MNTVLEMCLSFFVKPENELIANIPWSAGLNMWEINLIE